MIDHLIFIFYLLFFLLSTIGYGFQFSTYISSKFTNLNLGWYGIFGLFILSSISILTSFFTPHGFFHNSIIHIFGFMLFLMNSSKKVKIVDYKLLIIIFFLLLIGSYVYKNHDDFSYYHLTYAFNLSENRFLIGTGNFSHGFRTFSSLFYYHSILYMPLIEYYLFHIGPFYLVIFFNYVVLYKLFKELKFQDDLFIHFFCLVSLLFVNIVFYRISEHGTDRSAQIILILIFLIFIEIYYNYLRSYETEKAIFLIIILITLAASMKAIYYLYFLLLPIIFLKKNILLNFFKKQNLTFSFVIIISLSLNLIIYYLNTGCFLYPAVTTCIFSNEWSIPKNEVELMSIHYEWWAKAGGGPEYSHDLNKETYIINFNWLSNWIDKYFFNKVTDTFLGIVLICLIPFASFFCSKTLKREKKRENFWLLYSILLVYLIEWFLKHPSLRYGGYILFALPVFIFFSSKVKNYKISKKKLINLTLLFVIISFLVFNLRNFIRLNKEIEIYGYKPLNNPFFYVEDVHSKVVAENEYKKIFFPVNNRCWASKTPCSYYKDLRLEKILWMDAVIRK